MQKRIIFGFILFVLLVAFICMVSRYRHAFTPGNFWESVVFCEYDGSDAHQCDLLASDRDGNRLRYILSVGGSPALSNSGNFVAARCLDATEICIIDLKTLPDYHVYPLANATMPRVMRIKIPEICAKKELLWIESISWSNNDNHLAVTCLSDDVTQTTSKICVISIADESSRCLDEINYQISCPTQTIDWSPAERKIVFSACGQIFLFDMSNYDLQYIAEGWAPSWSGDGNKVAFFSWGETAKGKLWKEVFPGLAIVDINRNDIRWVYPALVGKNAGEGRLIPICLGKYQGCKIAWSPANDALIFSAQYGLNSGKWSIFKIEIATQKISFVTTNLSNFYSEPDWVGSRRTFP